MNSVFDFSDVDETFSAFDTAGNSITSHRTTGESPINTVQVNFLNTGGFLAILVIAKILG